MKYSIAAGIQNLSMPLLNVKIANMKLTFLIDTGATHNVIASFVYEQMRDAFVLLNDKNKIMGVEGNSKETPIVEALVIIAGAGIRTKFSVVNMNNTIIQLQDETGLQLHGFLGIPFLMDNKCILNFCNQEITIGE
jgi:hypothetical protein